MKPIVYYPEVGGGTWPDRVAPDTGPAVRFAHKQLGAAWRVPQLLTGSSYKLPFPLLPDSECLPAAILLASKQREKVDRLVDYCRRLDGTEITVIPLPPEIDQVPHPIGTELAVRYAAKIFSNTAWIYLEADSVPLRPHWRSTVTQEYRAGQRLFMLPSLDGLSPYDVAAAIGVWPADTLSILPRECLQPPYFDHWIYLNRPEQLYLTKRIQHSYGNYDGMRVVRRWIFPADKSIIRPEAVIFHADPTQSIIRWGTRQAWYSSGDLGDVIAALPIIKQQGGGRLYLGPSHSSPGPREIMTRARFESIKPLLDLQPYIVEVGYMESFDPDTIDRDLSTFRNTPRRQRDPDRDNLATWQAKHIGREKLDVDPWLEVGETPWHGRVVCSRTLRYRNDKFPWEAVVHKYRDRILFVGTDTECADFQKNFGEVERIHADNILELARIINGAELQVSNQSLPWWLGAGLGKRIIQESWPEDPNCVIEREGLTYTRTSEEMQSLVHWLQDS